MTVKLSRAEERVFKYLVEHKLPVLASTLAKRFILSKSHTAAILKGLHDKGLADVIKMGSNKFYKLKD